MSDTTEKLSDFLPLSPDHNAERLAALKGLFPDLFTNEGKLNIDELKKVVDPALVSETERYDFRWYGKTASKREAFTPSRATLVYDKDRSVNPEKAGGNMIIEGENLEVLKLLSSSYRERIKCIYIDPPYNTGKDFVYSDRFAEGRQPYWEQTGVTENGVKVDTNTDSGGRYHSNWLSMMQSRLLVARYLLQPDGLVFVSIDDTEVVNLRRVMDEVFGEESRVAELVWKNKYNAGALTKGFSSVHEYILCYSRAAITSLTQPLTDEDIAQYKGQDSKYSTRGGYVTQPLATSSKDPRPNLVYPITIEGREIWPDRQWIWERNKIEKAIENDEVVVNETDGKVSVRVKQYLKDENGKMREKKPLSILIGPYNQEGTKETDALLGVGIFTFPKPVALLKHFFSLTVNEPNHRDGIYLDFFGGSGTTAQAVMELNSFDKGNRKFILVQLPELTAADSPAFKAGYKKISDITIERANRVIARYQSDVEGLLPNDPQKEFADNLGFKVFKLAKSNFPRVEFAPDPDKSEAENIEALKHYINEKEKTFHLQWERETVLDEVLLKNGFMLDYTLTPRPEFKKNAVFLAKDAHKESLICLDSRIAPETVDHFQKNTKLFFICLELALDTTKKWNLKHHLGDKLKAI